MPTRHEEWPTTLIEQCVRHGFKHLPGEKVTIVNEPTDLFVSDMECWLGKEMTITSCTIEGHHKYYHMHEDDIRWYWDDECFQDEAKTELPENAAELLEGLLS